MKKRGRPRKSDVEITRKPGRPKKSDSTVEAVHKPGRRGRKKMEPVSKASSELKKPVEKKAKVDNSLGDKHVRTGCLHFGDLDTMAPIFPEVSTFTSKSGVEEGKDRGMAPNAHKVVPHGVYVCPFDVNINMMHRLGTSVVDIQAALYTMPYAYSLNPSRSRNAANVTIRGYWLFIHDNRLGSGAQATELISLVTPKPKIAQPSSWADYDNQQPTVAQVEEAMKQRFPYTFSGGKPRIQVIDLKTELMDKV